MKQGIIIALIMFALSAFCTACSSVPPSDPVVQITEDDPVELARKKANCPTCLVVDGKSPYAGTEKGDRP